jgi:hypothetical protein
VAYLITLKIVFLLKLLPSSLIITALGAFVPLLGLIYGWVRRILLSRVIGRLWLVLFLLLLFIQAAVALEACQGTSGFHA